MCSRFVPCAVLVAEAASGRIGAENGRSAVTMTAAAEGR
jgi:hypothetical protein